MSILDMDGIFEDEMCLCFVEVRACYLAVVKED